MNSVIVSSPAMPYWATIPGSMAPGKTINIKGIFPPALDPSVYSQINLCEGTKDIIALHISIRFNHREVVRNSLKYGQWEKEEKGGPFPFEFGSEFWMHIVVQQDAYHISVNGQECWTFAHRMPFFHVNALNIDGPFQIYQIEYADQSAMFRPGIYQPTAPLPRPGFDSRGFVPPNPYQPGGCRPPLPVPRPGFDSGSFQIPNPYQPGSLQPAMPFLPPVHNPPVPFTQIISGGIQPGMMFYISGMPRPTFKRFTVNFQCGSAVEPPPDIAFHFDVRAFSGSVVRNTRRDNTWGKEEVASTHFPFQPTVPFDMMILVQSDKYMVAVNGQHYVEYGHRMTQFSMINTLRIENDINITSVRFGR